MIVEEFVDAGESARKADRPELMRMIQYVTRHKTNYCIVHKVDRLARNRADDVTIHLALKDAGVTLVSATENIDETPRACCCMASCRRSPSSTPATSPPRSSRGCHRRQRREAR
ncbi:recombinase family protein [Tessaracoccus coleopterorum]|uniref:recombinase family protein n=1 Tax=Tessaracoccus coleopterorum TaxID=2714950 RepID=UPI002F919E5A